MARAGSSSSQDGESARGKGASLASRTIRATGVPDTLHLLVEQLLSRVIRPFDLVLLSRERIEEVLDDAAEQGRLTRSDAHLLGLELLRRGRQQTDDLLSQLEGLLRRSPRAGGAEGLPIADYDELTARQVAEAIGDLERGQLESVRDYEQRHANRKSVLSSLDRALRRS
jgi:hypothetical protein